MTRAVVSKEERSCRVFSFRDRSLAAILSIERFYDRHGLAVFWMIMAVFAARAWVSSKSKALWFDELLGLSAATAPHLRDVFSALAKPIDINPPLFDLLVRLSIRLLGYSAFAARLPAFLGVLAFLFCLYLFISRRLSPSYGVLGVVLVLSSDAVTYAWESRPYGLLLGLTGAAMVCYQRRTSRRGAGSLIALLVVCASLPCTHYYGVLVIGPFLVAELVRAIRDQQMDWPLLGVMVMAPGLALILLSPLIIRQRAAIAHFNSPGYPHSFIQGADLISPPAWTFSIALVVLAWGCWMAASERDVKDTDVERRFSSAEWVLGGGLLCL
jgi:hypothetical protein